MSLQRALAVVFSLLLIVSVSLAQQRQEYEPDWDALIKDSPQIEGSLFYPLPSPCPLFSLEGTTSGEPMALMARGDDLSQQGGSASGCGIPDDATALMIQLRLESSSDSPIRLKIWSMDGPEPVDALIDSFSGFSDNTMAIVSLNQPDDSKTREFQISSSEWGLMEGQVVGYFRKPGVRDLLGGGVSFFTESTASTFNNFFGYNAGGNTTSGVTGNSFFGHFAGYGNTSGIPNHGEYNAFFGSFAGYFNTWGIFNVFNGTNAGLSNTSGSYNVFSGSFAGSDNTLEDYNTMIGHEADLDPGPDPWNFPVENATAIGSWAYVSKSNSLVLGSIAGVNGATANVNIGIGTTAPSAPLHVSRSDSTVKIIMAESTGPETVRNMMDLKNNGMAQFRLIDTSPNGDAWQFSNTDNNLNISLQGSGTQEFLIENDGDVWINNGTIMVTSYRASKENFAEIDPQDVLNQLSQLPVTTWNYKKESKDIRHMGPVSEDFHAAFGLGQDDQHISPNDLAGVNSVAIQALYRKSIEDGANLKELLEERDRKIESLESELERLKRQIAEIRQVVATVGVESTGVAE